jgi:monolysocardiolipin acyltransferase
MSKFFMLGQTLPTHRAMYSPHGGLFQPTITQCIRLLSAGPFTTPTPPHPSWPSHLGEHGQSHELMDPFADPTHVYTTTGRDEYQAPSSYATRKHAWVHMFPEGRVHQHPTHGMRYFKWGAARLILESEPCPDVVPIFIEGFADVMREERPEPMWKPALGKTLGVTYGTKIDPAVLEGFRQRWQRLVQKYGAGKPELNDELMHGMEATTLRIEIAKTLRGEVEKLRRSKGYPDEDPKTGVWETWKEEGSLGSGRKADGSVVGNT